MAFPLPCISLIKVAITKLKNAENAKIIKEATVPTS